MTLDFSLWKHVFKLDPDRQIGDPELERICLSGTDAILVGGSSGVTYENTSGLLTRIRRYAVSCALEISSEEALVPGFDLYLVPVVLNTDEGQWMTGRQQRVIRDLGPFIDWNRVAAEGYVILNEHCTAAKVTGAKRLDEAEDLAAYARMADKLFRLPIFYVEYSGAFGNMEWVREAKQALEQTRLFYGGGIDGAAKAREAAETAHTVVVGNIIYDHLERALETVQAVKPGVPKFF